MPFDTMHHRITFAGGSMLLHKGRWRPAAFLLGRAIVRDPDDWEAHNNLAMALLKLERWDAAARVAERAIELDPTAADSHDFFGIALLQSERWEEAAAAYRRALTVDPDRYDSHDRLGMALWRLGRWDELIEACEAALKLEEERYAVHNRLGVALLQLGRWDGAAAAFRRALELAADDPLAASELPGLRERLVTATGRLGISGGALSAAFVQRAELESPGATARLARAIEHLKVEEWDEAVAELATGSAHSPNLGAPYFLQVDALVRLGSWAGALAAHRKAVEMGGDMPPLPGPPATERFTDRQVSFWTAENLVPDAFAVERWLEELSVVGDETTSGPRLMFVLDNDFGELTTVKYLLLGQALAGGSTLLLPERLYAHNGDAIPGRTHEYRSVDDVLEAVDRDHSEVVLLCSGYLLCPHLAFPSDELARLIDGLRARGCRVVTADPFLGMLSKHDPRTLIRFEVSDERAGGKKVPLVGVQGGVEEMMKSRRDAEERTWTSFTRSEKILRDTYHLYPSYCEEAENDVVETDARNLAFFNDRLLRPPPTASDGVVKPHWLFTLSSADCEIQAVLEGEAGFVDIVASKLVETVAAGRHPILIGPRDFLAKLMPRMPTAEGIDILSHCPFDRFMSLLLSAEQAFYWNTVSHSLLIRLYNQLPVVQLDRGHLIRTAPAINDRIVRWYYQGWAPPLRDHREPLTLETVEAWTDEYRPHAERLAARFRRAPSPEQMFADLMDRARASKPEPDMAER